MIIILFTKTIDKKTGSVVKTNPTEIETLRTQALQRTFRNEKGAEIQTELKIFIDGYIEKPANAGITYNGKDYEILSWYQVKDIDGNNHHLEIII
jgi:hypothetical protein